MIEKIIGIIKEINGNYALIFFNNLYLKIHILNFEKEKYIVNKEIQTYIYLDKNDFNIYSFLKQENKEIFTELLKVDRVGLKTAFRIIDSFADGDLMKLFQNYEIDKFIEKTKIKLSITENIFRHINKKYFDIYFNNLEKKIIRILIKLGYQPRNVYQTINKNKKLINTSNFPLDFILKKVIEDISSKVC